MFSRECIFPHNNKLFNVLYVTSKLCRLSSSPDDPEYIPSLERDDCGVAGKHGGFITGGEDSRLGQFPFLALLGKISADSITFLCGATIINKW